MMPEQWPGGPEEDAPAGISFHHEDVAFLPDSPSLLERWVEAVIEKENCTLQELTYIFCSDEYLYQVNLEYLSHDTYTDIITFPYQPPPVVYSDIFISIDRVQENAAELGLPFEQELHRVMIHGVLHLCGYPDKTPAEAAAMRQKEDEALALLARLQQ
ncbi:rRNA maturation RNase YbeY [Phaeodactylibacter luteus]|nr:rRNA maturation RNase YbeY [Phaeodactylibacter luteus]